MGKYPRVIRMRDKRTRIASSGQGSLSLATLLELARTLPIDTIDRVTRGLMDPLPPRFRASERIELFRCWFQTTEDILRGALVCFKILDLLADILKV